MTNEPNWLIVAIIGAVIGYLFPYVFQFVRFIYRRIQQTRYEGKWFVYHITNRGGKPDLIETTWNIKKGFSEAFVVESTSYGSNEVLYKGSMSFERNFWMVRMEAIKHHENVTVRVFDAIPPDDKQTYGLFLSLDFDSKIIAGPVLLSRKSLDTENAKQLMLEKTNLIPDVKTLVV